MMLAHFLGGPATGFLLAILPIVAAATTTSNPHEVAAVYQNDYGFPLRITILNSSVEDTPSTVQWSSKKNTFDAPKVAHMSSTTYQNWWFDAVTPDGEAAFTVNFLTTPANAAGVVPDGHAGASIVAILRRQSRVRPA